MADWLLSLLFIITFGGLQQLNQYSFTAHEVISNKLLLNKDRVWVLLLNLEYCLFTRRNFHLSWELILGLFGIKLLWFCLVGFFYHHLLLLFPLFSCEVWLAAPTTTCTSPPTFCISGMDKALVLYCVLFVYVTGAVVSTSWLGHSSCSCFQVNENLQFAVLCPPSYVCLAGV